MSSPFSIGASALRAFDTYLSSTANNIANINTEGYSQNEVSFQESPGGGVTTTVGRESGVDRVDLSREAVALIEAQRGFEANTKVIKAEDEKFESLLDVMG